MQASLFWEHVEGSPKWIQPAVFPRLPDIPTPRLFTIKGQGRVTKTGCAYTDKDEEWVWLCGTTTLLVMEGAEGCVSQTHAGRARTHSGRDEIARKVEEEAWEVARGITVATIFRAPSPTMIIYDPRGRGESNFVLRHILRKIFFRELVTLQQSKQNSVSAKAHLNKRRLFVVHLSTL